MEADPAGARLSRAGKEAFKEIQRQTGSSLVNNKNRQEHHLHRVIKKGKK